MNFFLYPELRAVEKGATVRLSREQSNHILKVFRTRTGEELALIDGQGMLALAKLRAASGGGLCEVEILNIEHRKPQWKVSIAFGFPKNPSLEFILKKGTEIGVRNFEPLRTRHSRSEREWRPDRGERMIEEVCKQCQELYFPALKPIQNLETWLKSLGDRILVYCDEENRQGSSTVPLASIGSAANSEYVLLIGPEGGWSDEERALILAHRPFVLGLGKNRLRAETAALAGAVLLKQILGEFAKSG